MLPGRDARASCRRGMTRSSARHDCRFGCRALPKLSRKEIAMHILWALIVGFIVTSLLGIAGSVVASFIGHSLGWYRASDVGPGLIASVIGAVILLAVYRAFVG